MQRGRIEVVVGLALGVALVASVSFNYWEWRHLAGLEKEQAADLESFRKLRESMRPREVRKAPEEAGSVTPLDGEQAALARREATITRLDRQLSEARASIADLQTQLAKSNGDREKAVAAVTLRQQTEKNDWQTQLNNLKQELGSTQDELQASRQRIAALEANNAKLGTDGQMSSARAAELNRVINDLQDLDRRRETYLTSIMRRYRDITSQFQAMSGMLDSSHDSNSTAFSSTALTRIQNAIALADDDLRQLTELNAQSRQLEKKLPKK